MFAVVPTRVETLMDRRPWSNWVLMATIIGFSTAFLTGFVPESLAGLFVLGRFPNLGIFGHVLLHADFLHLAGNMVFLWVFGNAVCANTSDRVYLFLAAITTLGAGTCHLLIEEDPAIGASGLTNGIVGVTLAMYPVNRVHMGGFLFFRPFSFSMRVWHLAALYFTLDLSGVLLGGEGIAYWAHLGGVAIGLGAGLLGLKTKILAVTSYDNEPLLEIFGGERSEIETDDDGEGTAALPEVTAYTFTPPAESRAKPVEVRVPGSPGGGRSGP